MEEDSGRSDAGTPLVLSLRFEPEYRLYLLGTLTVGPFLAER